MIPELGQIALLLALAMAVVLSIFPLLGVSKGVIMWMAIAKPAARIQWLAITTALACLTISFIENDFSVAYVANNSNSKLPMVYRISAVWGAHEGSLLLWAWTLSTWTLAVSFFSRSIPVNMVARVLAVMGLVNIGFLLFMILTSNPFERLLPAPIEGRDLNPLLQDFGLIIHPPMLYMGYVGFSVAFAFAIAAMWSGRLDAAWARWTRPWTNVAWLFLTGGIALGSWWAYYELGWGGWWFWDPVENASFMPWLVGTALIHSLAVTEKRGIFKAWTILLAVLAFSLSLLGTFLVRSGVLTSVHAFATDPGRGVFILIFLCIVVGGSLLLYSFRAHRFKSVGRFEMFSRESMLLVNNVLLVVTTASILLGTLYPLLLDALGLGKISVGPPYFNSIFIPLMLPLAIFAGIGINTRWKGDQMQRVFKEIWLWMVASVGISLALTFLILPHFTWGAWLGLTLAVWLLLTHVDFLKERLRGRSWASVPLGIYGMTVAHLGMAVFIVGITLTSIYSQEKDVGMGMDDKFSMGDYDFVFKGVKEVAGPNYQAKEATLEVYRSDERIAVLHPQKRIYEVQRNPMTEAAIDAGLTRDLFVALGDPLSDSGAWSVRLYVKPYIRWIWIGALLMAIGGLLAASDRRYRQVARKTAKTPITATDASA